MTTIPPGTSGQPEPPTERMSAPHMLLLVAGVLLAAVAPAVLVNFRPVFTGLALLAVGITFIIAGAAGLGRGMQPDAPSDVADEASDVADEAGTQNYPARIVGQLDPDLSRWKWLFKWLLAIPHYIVLCVLWLAFLVVTLAAGVAILFTGRYPASLFQFSVGVLRWNWRVSFYAYGVLGTDRYPPFTLARSNYPAEFDVAYPQHLSHWQVLVKSWLFALPQLLIVGALTGGVWGASPDDSRAGISLLGLLVLIAAVILLFTGVYRVGLFNLLMGINRWVYRTVVYAALMRDDYPPFRLDQGPFDPPGRPAAT